MRIVDLSDRSLGVSAMEVHALRDSSGAGMMECKKYLKKKALVEGIEQAQDIEDLRQGMLRMVEMMVFRT